MEFLHARAVIHRDIKSENLLLTNVGGNERRLKIGDFGISMADASPDDVVQLGTDACRGTPMYMAPETHDDKMYTTASDWFAMGCVLYELCTLQHPFQHAKNYEELKVRMNEAIYLPVDAYRGNAVGLHENVEPLGRLADHLLEPKMERRATIVDVVQCPLLTQTYHKNYFTYEEVNSQTLL